jgi:hypothetical protein
MSSTNVAAPKPKIYTAEGAPAKRITPEQQLRRLVLSTFLWEDQFYVDGQSIADLIKATIPKCSAVMVADLAVEARTKYKLRHVPLYMAVVLNEFKTHRHVVESLLPRILQRPDEFGEFLSLYWKMHPKPTSSQSKRTNAQLSHRIRRGLTAAFEYLDNEYSMAKWDSAKSPIRLLDVMRLLHPKPKTEEQGKLWGKLKTDSLATPNTWETRLSAGENKKNVWEDLLKANQLGALALLRNLRNMQKEKVSEDLIRRGLKTMRVERVLPFRFIAAAKYAPQFEPELEEAMFKCLDGAQRLPGKTLLLVDVSGSMNDVISHHNEPNPFTGQVARKASDVNRIDAACALAMLCRELCEFGSISTFSDQFVAVPPRRGFALRDAILQSQAHNGTYLGQAVTSANTHYDYDRLIVFTDEQSHDVVPDPKGKGYVVNVASNKNGIGYGKWTHIDGFSEAIFDWIREEELLDRQGEEELNQEPTIECFGQHGPIIATPADWIAAWGPVVLG